MSLRKAAVRIRHLPKDSALVRAMAKDETRWGETDYLIAQLIDVTHAAAGSDWRVPRPGSPEELDAIAKAKREVETRARMRARFDERQRRRLEGGSG